MSEEAMISIPVNFYESLLKDSAKLEALEACGVDEWEVYDEAMKMLDAEKD